MMIHPWKLEEKREVLKRRIAENMDFLIGSISPQGRRGGFNLTFKIDQVTKSRHIRKALLPEVKRMTGRYRRLKDLLKELSDVNWELLKLKSK